MPKKRPAATPVPPDQLFRKELTGENPPSFQALRSLCDAAVQLASRKPWDLLRETQLVLVRSRATNELCYCTLMGSLGEVFALHVYIGPQSFRIFQKIMSQELDGAREFYGGQQSVSVEFVTVEGMQKPDRDLLTALGCPPGRGARYPIFRAIRPGFYPWFINADEGQILSDCIQAVKMVCFMVAAGRGSSLWDDEQGLQPLVSQASSGAPEAQIEQVKVSLTPAAPAPKPACVAEGTVEQLRESQYPMRGVMEIGYLADVIQTGGKYERKECSCVALAVDGQTGILYEPKISNARVPLADAMASVFVSAVQSLRQFPKEVRVRRQDHRDALFPLLQSLNIAVRVARSLPALDEATAALAKSLP